VLVGLFDEGKYLVSQPRPKPRMTSSPPPPPRSSEAPPELSSSPGPSSPTRPSTPRDGPDGNGNEDEEQIISAPRLPHDTLRVWASVLGSRGFVVDGGKLTRSPTKRAVSIAKTKGSSPQANKRRPSTREPDEDARGGVARSLLSTFTRVNSFAPASADVSGPKRAFRRAATLATNEGSKDDSLSFLGGMRSISDNARAGSSNVAAQGEARTISGDETSSSQLFAGKRVITLGEARSATVRDAVERAGGKVISEDDIEADEADWIIVRLVR
jgi:DNA replication regulator DPB11